MTTGTSPSTAPDGNPLIVVAGDALVDLIVRPSGDIIPVGGGGPYNSVRAIARLGMQTAWIGGLSSDRFGRMLEAGLVADGVGLELVQRTDNPTTLALAELGADGSAAYRFYIEGTSAPAVLPGAARRRAARLHARRPHRNPGNGARAHGDHPGGDGRGPRG